MQLQARLRAEHATVALLTRELQRVDLRGGELHAHVEDSPPHAQVPTHGSPPPYDGEMPGHEACPLQEPSSPAASGGVTAVVGSVAGSGAPLGVGCVMVADRAAGSHAVAGGLHCGMSKPPGDGARSSAGAPEAEGDASSSDALATGAQPRHSISSCTGSIGTGNGGLIHVSISAVGGSINSGDGGLVQASIAGGGGHAHNGTTVHALHSLTGLHAQHSSGSGDARNSSGWEASPDAGVPPLEGHVADAGLPPLVGDRATGSSTGGDDGGASSAMCGARDGGDWRSPESHSQSPGGSWSSGSPREPPPPPDQPSSHRGAGSSLSRPGLFTASAWGECGAWQPTDRPAAAGREAAERAAPVVERYGGTSEGGTDGGPGAAARIDSAGVGAIPSLYASHSLVCRAATVSPGSPGVTTDASLAGLLAPRGLLCMAWEEHTSPGQPRSRPRMGIVEEGGMHDVLIGVGPRLGSA